MTKEDKENVLSSILCGVENARSCEFLSEKECVKFEKCRICEKTDEQLDYILSPHDQCTYLAACAGSGKTEVLGMKAAYEICRWDDNKTGIAILTFTNEAANTIEERVRLFYPTSMPSTHYIGTLASFIHGYIVQKFGYSFYKQDKERDDCSFIVVDKNASVYNNAWLNNYRLAFPVPNGVEPIYAHQIFYQASDAKLYIEMGENSSIEISNYYKFPKVQECIDKKREEKKKKSLYQYSYFKNQITKLKKRFFADGFATFDDMNVIAKKCLQSNDIVEKLASKFPLIMVDECQDLAVIELQLLDLLRKAGSSIHFIGDLNQAIYAFKDAIPESLEKHIEKERFHTMRLKDNFRSCQSIVDVACSLQSIDGGIKGRAENLFEESAVYFEYERETEALECFKRLLNKNGISAKNAIALTRNTSLKEKLYAGGSIDYRKHPIINAIQLWGINAPESKKDALLLLGQRIQRWLGSTGRKDNYYCPDTYDNVFRWRIMLRDILNEFTKSDAINCFSGNKYGEWYPATKNDVLCIIDANVKWAFSHETFDFTSASYRTPNKTAAVGIQVLSEIENNALRVGTIHSVKGCSYDAVLVVSSPNRSGKTGYWERWIDDKNETTRFGYVASTRPRYLLAWAVPKLTDGQRIKIESIGLHKTSIQFL